MDAALLALAAVWGAVTGLLIPRAAYRFAVEPEEPWRTACPAGHPCTGPVRGWLGPARCAPCAAAPGAPAAPGTDTAGTEAVGTTAGTDTTPGTDTAVGRSAATPGAAPAEAGRVAGTPAPGPVAYAPGVLAPVVTVVACVALAAATGARPELIGWLALTPVAVLLAAVDRRVHRLPDPLTLPLAAAVVLLLGGAALLPGHAGSWTSGLLGGLALGGFYFLLFLINPNGMGFGDVKLALALGVALGWYGWTVLFVGGFAGFLFGALYGLALVLLRRAGRRTGIPFGPFMIGGALTGLLLGALAG
ncbi:MULTISPECIES: prepilin peptidase [Streptomyces]|uniref:prepilin peptidase n=1 Tax=Streptomyces TaxID=1883 RepID=UPI000851FFC5|nr:MULTISPECIES: A24 family peptidase [unclassified Streptomyces]MBQ1108414.1 prepilin peptidase [Streptomyces sp. 404i]MDQ0696161.1 leader peptidase (prepilin peptidase)/N-methyltransferase [Streptomyces sp. W4I9-2]MDX3485776.1 A24 family peptidase [Streptomyces sp. ID05-18]